MKRRDFITLVGGAAAWPGGALAQQGERVRRIGVLMNLTSHDPEGQARLAAMAADLVSRRVTMIFANGPSVPSAKAATTTIPIVFTAGFDPIKFGLVASLSRPGGNLTGVSILNVELGPKRLDLVRELVPATTNVAVLVNPKNPNVESLSKEMQAASRALGLQIHLLQASTEGELDAAFAKVRQTRAAALVIGTDPFFTTSSPTACHVVAALRDTDDLPIPRLCRRRWPHELRRQPHRRLPSGGRLCGPCAEG